MNIVISDTGAKWRGSQVITATLARGFRRHGHNVIVFCRPESALLERLANEVTCDPVLSGGDSNPVTIARCVFALRRHRADTVIAQNDKDVRLSGVAARIRKTPLIILHNTDRPLKNKLRYRFYYGSRDSIHVPNSQATKKTLQDSAPWLKAPVHVIPNGIDVDRFANAESMDLQLPANSVAVGFVGNFETRKGIIDFAKAWHIAAPQIPHAHAVIAGRGHRQPQFEAALHGAPRVHMLGFQPNVSGLMKALDVFVFPSLFEGFGLVMAEAMAAGAAVVGYDASSLPEIAVNGEEALLVPLRDVDALADAIVRVCKDDGLRARLAAAGQARVRRDFTEEKMVDRYLDLIGSVVKTDLDD
jgi:glycosyltransferase involved in cell wall biosynthesis